MFFRQYSSDPLIGREWPLSHVPVILHEDEWETICAGLRQRANLLERLMADLYGPGTLVRDGHLPAELIAGSRQWLRPMVGIAPRGGHYLHLLAFEIGRSPDGSWFVLGDRTQAPSGAGFALENRIATGRIFPERFPRAHIHRLAGFFGAFREAMERLAASNGQQSAAAILTPGPSNDTYYEHTYIARYLGMMLLEGEDLLVQNGQAMVRTIEGPKPLGVLWRRIDAAYACDVPFDVSGDTAIASQLADRPDRSIADWLAQEGAGLVGQEAVTLSTTPAWVDEGEGGGRVLPRPMTIRVFAARTPEGWVFMKGGYARIGRSGDATALAMQRGGSVADVWVMSERQVPQKTLVPRESADLRASPGILPARAADNLFWLGRYVERTEDAIRMIRSYHLRLASTDNPNDARLKLIAAYMARNGYDLSAPVPEALVTGIDAARGCASKLRDRFSTDGWGALADLARTAHGMTETARPGDDAARAMSVLVRKITGFSGLVHENMYRFNGWRFLSFGRALERSDSLAAMLASFADSKAPDGALDIAV